MVGFVNCTPPHSISGWKIKDSTDIEIGEQKTAQAQTDQKNCKNTDIWPNIFISIHNVKLNSMLKKKLHM